MIFSIIRPQIDNNFDQIFYDYFFHYTRLEHTLSGKNSKAHFKTKAGVVRVSGGEAKGGGAPTLLSGAPPLGRYGHGL